MDFHSRFSFRWTIRSRQKTGGLFNCFSFSGVDVGKSNIMSDMVTGLLNDEEMMYDNATLNMISCNEADLINNDINELLAGPDSLLDSMLDCEVFTDFSDLLLDADGQPFKVPSDEQAASDDVSNPLLIETMTALETATSPTATSSSCLDVEHNYHHVASLKRKFTDEDDETSELPDISDDDEVEEVDVKRQRYLERRRKNNAASKRSRESKKTRMVEMEQQAVMLELGNESLRGRIVELERLTALMKSLLVQRVSAN